MPYVYGLLSFLLATAGMRYILHWATKSQLAERGRILVGDAHFREHREYVQFKKPSPSMFWKGVVLLFLSLIVFALSPLAPPWS